MLLEDLNQGQREIAEDILGKIDNVLQNYDEMSIEDRVFSISGSAGVGKSFLTSFLVEHANEKEYDITMTTPTHKALQVLIEMIYNSGVNVEAKTIYSYLGLVVKEDYNSGKYILQQDQDRVIEQTDILFVDESSMVSEELFSFIEQELTLDTIKIVIFIGDKYQSKPVEGGENPIYSGDFSCTSYELTEIVRQAKDNDIIKLATKIRDCIETAKFPDNKWIKKEINSIKSPNIEIVSSDGLLLERYFESTYPVDTNLVVAYRNKSVDRYNSRIRNTLIKSEDAYIVGEKLVFNEAHFVEDEAVHRNNEVVEIQRLSKFEDENLGISFWKMVDTKNKPFRIVDIKSLMDYEYELSELAKDAKKAEGAARSAIWKRFFELKNTFQNVAYTYCCTVYKSQGSSCSEVYIALDEILNMRRIIGEEALFRAIYVAITRAKFNLIIHMR